MMTTMGFAGESPATASGRLVSAVLMIAGFALMTLTTAAIASSLVREDEKLDLVAERHFERDTRQALLEIVSRLKKIENDRDADREPGSEHAEPTLPELRVGIHDSGGCRLGANRKPGLSLAAMPDATWRPTMG